VFREKYGMRVSGKIWDVCFGKYGMCVSGVEQDEGVAAEARLDWGGCNSCFQPPQTNPLSARQGRGAYSLFLPRIQQPPPQATNSPFPSAITAVGR